MAKPTSYPFQPGLVLTVLGVLLGYAAVFAVTRDTGPAGIAAATLRNAGSLLIAGLLGWLLLDRLTGRITGRGLWLHVPSAIMFSVSWLWLLTLAAAIGEAGSPMRFIFSPLLHGRAAEWQLLQGLFAYAALAAVHAARHARSLAGTPAAPTAVVPERPPPRSRLMVKVDDEIVPVAVDEIVSITGADDYAELVTTTRRHLVRTTLTDFAEQLDGGQFLRIHRSAIVNLSRIVRAEPAGGGRMIVHLERGDAIQASRAGARLLRGAIA